MTITHRKDTRKVRVGSLYMGGSNEVIIQSMTTTKTHDIEATVKQIKRLEKVGCQVIRVAVLGLDDAEAIKEIKKQINIPLVADIHFNYRLALKAIENGVDLIRLNPGNIGADENVKKVAQACKLAKIPIRIGVNTGSIEKHILEKYGHPTPEAMVESAKYHVELLEKFDFYDILISLKASDVDMAVKAYRLAAETFEYPLHLGITEAGTKFTGTIKSAIGIGIMLYEGIGSTIRVSLSADPVEEIKVCKQILKNVGLSSKVPTLISCPTCGRIQFDLFPVAQEIEDYLEKIESDIKVAVMGCAVNGPGEAREADIGIAGGKGMGLLMKNGEVIRKVKQEDMVNALKEEIDLMVKERSK
ncbi:flavodoxin-dependent (E)-4-hydroxy-3-methylbut-2-enyl-diphosphate synthase [Haloplasma contractile]|uniref:4-hydroxy-3-methylbut-2-en-1-yl diphosphate synthase (flavodoxin) n=1 Tax=Haloplasma contractile SSD-17B TaxID=1033810 RepID=U2FS66_9MOLU|nr:flavodoxin-dependent (E)-4-hydroxy-3-methylbut-2-enyl-diphosphate synthase [Haloplasma contractile]ERJ13794.1 4-hydroxy-3-methylbut-2-en-1-yl diphosphate synthase protein [Haloplasma contractile SSD-17B]